ncbi:MAG: serine/threonine-protein kinase, partial [Vicinamibacterales bacterium]
MVYRAHDTLLERVVALKVIAASINDNPELRERFFREARAAGQLSHRHIITIHDLGEHEGQPYLAMEYLTGEDLQRRLARPEAMSLLRKLEIAAEICDGLSYAHRRGVIHRDIKPANIFITDDGIVKILDFGLARMVASEVTASNMMLGTLNYMAPEQVRGERTDHRADIFSFGVVFYEILSGRKAFQGDSYATTLYKILQEVPDPLLSIDATLPSEVVRIVEKSLAKPRDERYQDLTDLARDLALVRQHLSTHDAATIAAHAGSAAREPSDLAHGSEITTGTMAIERRPATTPPQPRQTTDARGGRMRLVAIGVLVIAAATATWLTFSRRGNDDRPAPPMSTAETSPPAAEPAAPAPAPGPPPVEATPSKSAEEIRRNAAEARDYMNRVKASARAAGTAAQRSASFREAAAAERAAIRLFDAGRLAEATPRFYEAAGLYRSAEVAATIASSEPQTPRSPPPASKSAEPAPAPAPTPPPPQV